MAASEITVSSAKLYYGTDAEINALTGTKGDVGFATDTGKEYTNTDGGTTWVLTRTAISGSSYVNVQNAALTVQNIATGGPISIASGTSQSLGDTTIYGLPFGSIVLDPSGATDSFAGAYALGNGKLIIQITRTGSTDTVSLTATSPETDVIAGPLAVVDNAGAIATTITTGVYYMYFGAGAVS